MKTVLLILSLLASVHFNVAANNKQNDVQARLDTIKKGKNYTLFSKSENVESVTFSKKKKSNSDIIYIRFGLTTPEPTFGRINGTVITSKRYKEDGTIPIFDKIEIIKGKYEDIKMSKHTKIKNLFAFLKPEFPIRLKLISGNEYIDLELLEAGEWDLEISLKNN